MSPTEMIDFWADNLPDLCCDVYRARVTRETAIVSLQFGTFTYIFDSFQSPTERYDRNDLDWDDARLVVAFGRSTPIERSRSHDDYRLKGWVGKTNTALGKEWDKGHFIAHTLGGAVDHFEANIFVQRRDCNRGWSEEGRLYRKMEKYCATHPGTFCFSRPFYERGLFFVARYDFGLLKSDGELWVNRFDNTPPPTWRAPERR